VGAVDERVSTGPALRSSAKPLSSLIALKMSALASMRDSTVVRNLLTKTMRKLSSVLAFARAANSGSATQSPLNCSNAGRR
jgi:hypothetical protein